jgi:hypothetical protein
MTVCSHTLCGKEKRVWLPCTFTGYGSVEKHLWCTTCGVIQNTTDDRPKNIGYWMNKLSCVASELSLTRCQIRLIAKDLESHEYLHDSFSAFGTHQKELFIHILSKYCDVATIDFDTILALTN